MPLQLLIHALHALPLHICQPLRTHLGTPPTSHWARQDDTKFLAQFNANKEQVLTKRLDDRKPPKPGQIYQGQPGSAGSPEQGRRWARGVQPVLSGPGRHH